MFWLWVKKKKDQIWWLQALICLFVFNYPLNKNGFSFRLFRTYWPFFGCRKEWAALGNMEKEEAMLDFVKLLNKCCNLFAPYVISHKIEREEQERKRWGVQLRLLLCLKCKNVQLRLRVFRIFCEVAFGLYYLTPPPLHTQTRAWNSSNLSSAFVYLWIKVSAGP